MPARLLFSSSLNPLTPPIDAEFDGFTPLKESGTGSGNDDIDKPAVLGKDNRRDVPADNARVAAVISAQQLGAGQFVGNGVCLVLCLSTGVVGPVQLDQA